MFTMSFIYKILFFVNGNYYYYHCLWRKRSVSIYNQISVIILNSLTVYFKMINTIHWCIYIMRKKNLNTYDCLVRINTSIKWNIASITKLKNKSKLIFTKLNWQGLVLFMILNSLKSSFIKSNRYQFPTFPTKFAFITKMPSWKFLLDSSLPFFR